MQWALNEIDENYLDDNNDTAEENKEPLTSIEVKKISPRRKLEDLLEDRALKRYLQEVYL